MEGEQQNIENAPIEVTSVTQSKLDEVDSVSESDDKKKLGENVETESVANEEVFTLDEIIEREKDMEDQAKILLGGADLKVCTYPEGYKSRQPLYSCLTCIASPESGAICFGCSVNCHEGHKLVELYTKRKVRCDCGNSKFSTTCTLYEEKSSLNPDNTYNHNYQGTFCVCKRPYPDDEIDEEMLQCCICEDWYHPTHIDAPIDENTDTSAVDLACINCTKKYPFLALFEKASEPICLKGRELSTCEKTVLLNNDWRKFLCSCSDCESLLFKNSVSYLLDNNDTIAVYEQESKEKTKNEDQEDEEQIVDELVKTAGRETAITLIKGLHDLKSNLGDFFKQIAQSGEVVTKEHVASFFQNIKRPRLDLEQNE